MEDRNLEEVSMIIRLPRHIRDDFKKAVKDGIEKESKATDLLISYMIQTIGRYNKQTRQASDSI